MAGQGGHSGIECELKIGAIVTLTDKNAKIGNGVLKSIEHVIARRRDELAGNGIALKIVEHGDYGSASDANAAAEACADEGCIAIFGPCDSRSMKEVVKNPKLGELPKLCAFATATDLAQATDNAFFRFTNNDRVRALQLVLKLIELVPDAREIAVYALSEPPDSYSQGLRRDVLDAAAGEGLIVQDREFSPPQPIVIPRSPKIPIIICSPSDQAVALIRQLQRRRFRGPIFGFGSNTNFRVARAIGLVVVADLDRHDPHPIIRRTLKEFSARSPGETEPSIATMSAVEVLINILMEQPCSVWKDVDRARALIVKRLQQGGANGLYGSISFHSNGELIGHETISLLRVRRSRGRIDFAPFDGPKLPPMPRRISWLAAIGWISLILGVLGLALGIITLMMATP